MLTASAGNSRHLQTLLVVCGKLLHFLGNRSQSHPEAAPMPSGGRSSKVAALEATVYTVNDLLFAAGLDDINMFRLTRYVAEACGSALRKTVHQQAMLEVDMLQPALLPLHRESQANTADKTMTTAAQAS